MVSDDEEMSKQEVGFVRTILVSRKSWHRYDDGLLVNDDETQAYYFGVLRQDDSLQQLWMVPEPGDPYGALPSSPKKKNPPHLNTVLQQAAIESEKLIARGVIVDVREKEVAATASEVREVPIAGECPLLDELEEVPTLTAVH
jgi:hypothetical protein